MSGTLVLICRTEDFDPVVGQCSSPFYSHPPSVLPPLTLEEGGLIAFSIVGLWTVGLIARLFIRAGQQRV